MDGASLSEGEDPPPYRAGSGISSPEPDVPGADIDEPGMPRGLACRALIELVSVGEPTSLGAGRPRKSSPSGGGPRAPKLLNR